MAEKIVQTAERDQLGGFAPMFARLNDDVLFGEVYRIARVVGEDVLLCRNMLKSRPSGKTTTEKREKKNQLRIQRRIRGWFFFCIQPGSTRLPCSGLIKILHCDQSQIGLISSIKPL